MRDDLNQSAMNPEFECPRCGHESTFDGDILHEIVSCSECNARIAYGSLQARLVVVKHSDPRFISLKIDEKEVVLDLELAHLLGLNIISICPPNRR
jgi:hypothetical protein